MFCQQCGTKTLAEARFCQTCGEPLAVDAPHDQASPSDSRASSRPNQHGLIENFKNSPKKTQGRIFAIVGVVLCLLGFLFSIGHWGMSHSFVRNMSIAKIVILEGQRVLIKKKKPHDPFSSDEYETRGRLAIPLKYVLVLGVLISAVGTGLLITQSQKGDTVEKSEGLPTKKNEET